jgi:hypothetical protein
VSKHEIANQYYKFVFGWDQPLQSFFLQIHNLEMDEEENPVFWYGADKDTEMYEVEDLARAMAKHHYKLDEETKVALYREKDDGV